MALTIVRVTSGGVPVTESDRGMPYYEADNGFGIPVRFVAQAGAPVCIAAAPFGQQLLTGADSNGADQNITVTDVNGIEQAITVATGLS